MSLVLEGVNCGSDLELSVSLAVEVCGLLGNMHSWIVSCIGASGAGGSLFQEKCLDKQYRVHKVQYMYTPCEDIIVAEYAMLGVPKVY